jgi:ribonuclease E
MPDGMGVIIRTAGVGRSAEELQWDLNYLLQLWEAISSAGEENRSTGPAVSGEQRHHPRRARLPARRRRPGADRLPGRVQAGHGFRQHGHAQVPAAHQALRRQHPLFNRFQIESQIETAFQREVRLPSGGSMVIDPTEALVSIDINSARATKGVNIEETALQTNLEAADESRAPAAPARHGRSDRHRLHRHARREEPARGGKPHARCARIDRARVQIGRISRFGLLEMSRQRLRPSLGETSAIVCPRCTGQGTIRDTKSLALSILRLLEEEAIKDRTAEVRAIVPVDVAAYLLNEKRTTLSEIEAISRVRVLVIPNPNLETPHFDVQRLRDDEVEGDQQTSYKVEIHPAQRRPRPHPKAPMRL